MRLAFTKLLGFLIERHKQRESERLIKDRESLFDLGSGGFLE